MSSENLTSCRGLDVSFILGQTSIKPAAQAPSLSILFILIDMLSLRFSGFISYLSTKSFYQYSILCQVSVWSLCSRKTFWRARSNPLLKHPTCTNDFIYLYVFLYLLQLKKLREYPSIYCIRSILIILKNQEIYPFHQNQIIILKGSYATTFPTDYFKHKNPKTVHVCLLCKLPQKCIFWGKISPATEGKLGLCIMAKSRTKNYWCTYTEKMSEIRIYCLWPPYYKDANLPPEKHRRIQTITFSFYFCTEQFIGINVVYKDS